MNTKSYANGTSIMRTIMIFSIFSSVFGVILLYKMDSTIHGDLYNFGLQFDYNWALLMWTLERLLGVCLILPMVFNAGALIWDFRMSKNKEVIVKREEPKLQMRQKPQQQPQPQLRRQPPQVQPNNNGIKGRALKEDSMIISCPNCKKVFSKPLVMLDFSNKKTQLVNVCPYCNTVLGRASNQVEKEDIDVGVLDLDEKTKESK
jgi:uncharacterized Zn-finger protein